MASKKKIRLLIADDHSIVRSGLRALLESGEHFAVIGEATNGEQAIRMATKTKPDVILLDLSMPKLSGIEAARLLKEKLPQLKILILTIYESEEYVSQMVGAGVDGYVLKNADRKELLDAISTVASGKRYFSRKISDIIIDGFIKKTSSEEQPRTPPPVRKLSQREIQILQFIAQGLTSPQIAEKLFLSVRTVNTHRSNIMKKLGIHETAGLVRYAFEIGLLKLKS
ncbi:MAG TPA: response regulator transcription factor [Bacteroidota bacterium]|nr:response regulator transcription factor [Bacteroidota bacterium]